MINEMQITLFDLIGCLSDSMDLVSPMLVNHHKTVAYIGSRIAETMSCPEETQLNILLSGLLHDIGALPLDGRSETTEFTYSGIDKHCEIGYTLLDSIEMLNGLAPIVRYHHVRWDNRESLQLPADIPLESDILNLADRVAILIDPERNILVQAESIKQRIVDQRGKMFKPEVVDAFLALAEKEYFWFDMTSRRLYTLLRLRARLRTPQINLQQLLRMSLLFSKIIDFRSSFTATHSCGVSAVAAGLAQLFDFSDRECRMMKIAGHLHDLGKLAVPTEILEKPGKLTEEEFSVIKSHVYHTYRLLETLNGFDTITMWAAFHHERLDRKGYPFRHGRDVLPLGSRILGVADVFTAISEDRPYRPGMDPETAKKILVDMAANGALDPQVVSVLCNHFDDINLLRRESQSGLSEQYRRLFA